jgi:hypothetical protein
MTTRMTQWKNTDPSRQKRSEREQRADGCVNANIFRFILKTFCGKITGK